MPYPSKDERNAEMARLKAEGLTITEIGRQFGVSRQRVHKILKDLETPEPQDDDEDLHGDSGPALRNPF